MTSSNRSRSMVQVARLAALGTLAFFALTFISAPAFASAAVFAYVDVNGEVKSVTAPDWMTAIATAPGIHMHSGVMQLTTAADYLIVGDKVAK